MLRIITHSRALRYIWVASAFFIVRPAAIAQLAECTKTDCDNAKGIWACGTNGVPGDGTSHVAVTANGPPGAVACGQARAFRMGADNGFSGSCKVNPQPPTNANSKDRRCKSPNDDMSVEKCSSTTGSTASASCEYVNAQGAYPKFVELCACFSVPLKVGKSESNPPRPGKPLSVVKAKKAK